MRVIKNAPRELVGDVIPLPYRMLPDTVDQHIPSEVRKNAPYQKGDVLLVNFGTRTEPDIKRSKVVGVIPEPTVRGDFIPLYTVVYETKDGYWSRLWRRVYPGHIYRAYPENLE